MTFLDVFSESRYGKSFIAPVDWESCMQGLQLLQDRSRIVMDTRIRD